MPSNSPTDPQPLSFDNTEIAFRGKNNKDLSRAYWLFKVISSNFLTRIGPPVTNFAMKTGLPIKGLIKATIFRQFCGGETIGECEQTIRQLASGKVGTILDYSVEGEEKESVFTLTAEEIIKTIRRATGDPSVPITVFKITGVGRFGLLAKLDAGNELTNAEHVEYVKLKGRVDMICRAAADAEVPVMIDAEESWIQDTIDKLALDMMQRYNRDAVIVYNTYQLYRHDKLVSLQKDAARAKSSGFILGAKLVRGAYMEKERKRAEERGYPSPIQPDKASTDRDYDLALQFCLDHTAQVAIVAGTHNEESCRLLCQLMAERGISPGNRHVFFSQLLGMSDNLSFNLADAGYHVAKYVPYGPVEAVLPYLFRRAQENTSIAGQTGRELGLIVKEKKRRKI
ncbi:proline dehydrogenase family protein [Hufsiella ginkgonis]|uniref:Proline dehydrogenase n=1 Tax=Hufsiella ginkgonis TaxID=2695274 RepID=A0A7K1Y3D9_9SPHI|nr:proline dehydrogenase family protein [Hufsiella ginkgonis]MXV17761.1 proline dehydrogenase [Hufsiella ginkgonis]